MAFHNRVDLGPDIRLYIFICIQSAALYVAYTAVAVAAAAAACFCCASSCAGWQNLMLAH